MAELTSSFGYTDTTTTKKTISLPCINYASDYAVKEEVANATTLINTTTPVDQPETLRYAISDIANVYNNTGIDPAYWSQNKRGVALTFGLHNIYRVSGFPNNESIDLPVQIHTVIRVPQSQYLPTEAIFSDWLRQVSMALETNGTDESMLNSLLRGALNPKA